MIFRQLIDSELSTYTYLLGDESSRRALIIDPVLSKVSDYLRLLDELRLELDLSIETHTHADHITAQGALHDSTGCRMLVSRQSSVSCDCATFDGTRPIHCGELIVMPIHTPGHTPDSYCFYVLDQGRPILFTGDTC
jgi:sulfur dioxygenase